MKKKISAIMIGASMAVVIVFSFMPSEVIASDNPCIKESKKGKDGTWKSNSCSGSGTDCTVNLCTGQIL